MIFLKLSGFCSVCSLEFIYICKKISKINASALLKILTCFSVAIPASFALIYGIKSLIGRVQKLSNSAPINSSKIHQTTVRQYTGDLTPAEKQGVTLGPCYSDSVEIDLKKHCNLKIAIRDHDLFSSKAEVIVNPVSADLGKDGDVNKTIHLLGGDFYQWEQKALQKQYSSSFVPGYAVIIESGDLEISHRIKRVIVVAVTQGVSTREKENQLYSSYYNSLALAHAKGMSRIAFPSISDGFPKDRAVNISLKAIYDFMNDHPNTSLNVISIHVWKGGGNLAPNKDLMEYAMFFDPPRPIPQRTEVLEYSKDLTAEEATQLSIKESTRDKNTLRINFKRYSDFKVSVRNQDLFTSKARVIVNAANAHLGGGGGIDGAIHSKGGGVYAANHKALQTKYQGQYVLGYAAIIGSGALKDVYQIRFVIVVAGPQGATTPEKENQLYSCYYNSLVLAHLKGRSSIAFPSISTGIFGFPKFRAAHISLKAIYDFIHAYPKSSLKTISIHFQAKTDTERNQNFKEYKDCLPAPVLLEAVD